MRRWLLWFVLAPQAFLLAGMLESSALPRLDASVLFCLYLAFFAEQRALPGLLLGAAMGRALVDEAGLWVQVLVLGVPVAMLLPLRRWVFGQHWLWQATAGGVLAYLVPTFAGLCGRVFDQPSASANLDGTVVITSALAIPPLLWCLRVVPPFRGFEEGA